MKLKSQNSSPITIIILEFGIRFAEIISFNQTLPSPLPLPEILRQKT